MAGELENIIVAEDRILLEIQSNLTSFASIVGWGKHRIPAHTNVAYASSPITTGLRMYELFKARGVKSVDELNKIDPAIMRKEIMIPNIESGENFAQELRSAKQYAAVICPSTFFARGWTQEHYMSLWERVIENFATKVHFNDSWQYSNGCVEEYLIGLRTGKFLYEGTSVTPLEPKEALSKIKQALLEISEIGADIKQMYTAYRRIELFLFTRKNDAVPETHKLNL
ncbi:MAG: hypothetical protein HY363_02225 [Candidatus Aenigmarchaeota archaeon]|nr:hypothetical protein [Candidatus Aenigmarchaeota archaeon]